MKKEKSSANILYGTFKYLFVFLLFASLLCFIVSFFVLDTADVLDIFSNAYRLRRSFSLLIYVLPSIELSCFLFAFSILFSKMDAENMQERFKAMRSYLRALIVFLSMILAFNILVFCFLCPGINASLRYFENKSELYNSNLYKARRLKNTEDLHANRMAINFASHALEIDANSQVAIRLLEELSLKQAALLKVKPAAEKIVLQSDNLNVKALLNLAHDSAQNLDFFSAHYFAARAMEMTTKNSKERQIAQKVLNESWKAIENGDDTLQRKNRKLYEQKRSAYLAFRHGAYLKAYELFYEIKRSIKAEDDKQNDIQVNYFLAEINKKLSDYVFYYEDLERAAAFQNMHNFTFQIKDQSQKLYEMSIGGYSYKPAKKNDIDAIPYVFLENLLLTKYDSHNNVEWKIRCDYARLIGKQVSKANALSTLQFTMISSDRSMPDIFPHVITGTFLAKEMLSQELPISVQDFLLALEKQNDIKELSLSSLYKLAKVAPLFGYDAPYFWKEILFRFMLPCLLFTVSFFIASISWSFRFDYNHFKLYYVLVLPAIVALAQIILDVSLFVMLLVLDFYILRFGLFAFIIAIATWIIFSILYALTFYMQARN